MQKKKKKIENLQPPQSSYLRYFYGNSCCFYGNGFPVSLAIVICVCHNDNISTISIIEVGCSFIVIVFLP